MPALGQRFRTAREARGLSLSEVAEQVRIRSVYLAAIENEDWSAIGAPVYIRGFLRTYARFVGLDAEEVVAAFNLGEGARGALVPTRSEIEAARAGTFRRFQLSPMIWIASLVAITLIAFVVYNELTLRHPAPVADFQTPIPGPTLSPTPAPTLAATTAPTLSSTPSSSAVPSVSPLPEGNELSLRLTAPCWIRVTVDRRIVSEGTFPAGTTKAFAGRSVTLVVGNAGAAHLTLNGKDLGAMGAPGHVVVRSFIL